MFNRLDQLLFECADWVECRIMLPLRCRFGWHAVWCCSRGGMGCCCHGERDHA